MTAALEMLYQKSKLAHAEDGDAPSAYPGRSGRSELSAIETEGCSWGERVCSVAAAPLPTLHLLMEEAIAQVREGRGGEGKHARALHICNVFEFSSFKFELKFMKLM